METLSSTMVKDKARQLGFHLVGITSEMNATQEKFYKWWIDQGYGAEMKYLERQQQRRGSLCNILPDAKSAIVCGLHFPGEKTLPLLEKDPNEPYGRIARYAQGKDYHFVLKALLEKLAAFIDGHGKQKNKSLAYVDTGAIPERSLGVQAGLGWIGKNAMLIHPQEGSWFWMGEVISTAELEADLPIADHCGSCRRCIDACPTEAILENKRAVDSRKCISYLTIEHKGNIDEKYHPLMGDWILGCDICQEVCPWNDKNLRHERKEEGAPPIEWISLNKIQTMDEKQFQTEFRDRALSRPKLQGLQRNASIIQKK